jgi:hypothetical protein
VSTKIHDTSPPLPPKVHWIGPVRTEPEPRAWCGAIVGVGLIVTGVALLVGATVAVVLAFVRAFDQ